MHITTIGLKMRPRVPPARDATRRQAPGKSATTILILSYRKARVCQVSGAAFFLYIAACFDQRVRVSETTARVARVRWEPVVQDVEDDG